MTEETALAGHQHLRKRRLTYALATGFLSKASAVAVQWIALPLSLHALGTQRYAAFLALQALVAWSGLLALGLAPSLPRFISAAVAAGARWTERDIFQTAFLYLIAIAFVFAGAMLLLGYFVHPSVLVATSEVQHGEIWTAYRSVVLITALGLVGGVMPSVRGGYQELHYSNTWACVANLLVLAGLFFAMSGAPTISLFILVIYGPLAAVMLADIALICLQRPYLLHGKPNLAGTGKLLVPQAGNALAAQFAYFLVSFLPTLIVAHMRGPAETAAFGSIMQILIVTGSGMNLIYQPLVPAIANAYAHHDRPWVRRAYFRAAALVLAICGIGLVTDVLAGQFLLHKWLGANFAIPRELAIALGCYFSIWMVNVLHFNILAATGNLKSVGRAYLAEGLLSISLGSALTLVFGATGMALGLVLGSACVNLWYLSIQVQRRVVDQAYAE